MPNWTKAELLAYERRTSKKDFDGNPGATPVMERCSSDESLAKTSPEKEHSQRFLVRVASVRKRLLDEDNLCAKFHVDALRYAGLIPSDSPEQTHIEVFQRKPAIGEQEHIEIVIEQIPP